MPQFENDMGEARQHESFSGRLIGSDLLATTVEASADTELYSPIPEGYRRGFHKYVVVLGTVMSGLGKGIFASSAAKLITPWV